MAVLAFIASASAQTFPASGPATRAVNLVCIGDSITECKGVPNRAENSTPAVLARTLANWLGADTTVYLANVGLGGTTTADWDGTKGLLIKSADPKTDTLIAAHPHGRLVFSVMLGTNDSANTGPHGAPASAEKYGKTLRGIVEALVARYPDCIVFLHHPTWYSTNVRVASADYTGDTAHDRLLSYLPAIDAIANGDESRPKRHVYLGDTAAYDYFAKNYLTDIRPQKGLDGTFYLHPNQTGAAVLGIFWATPIWKALQH